MKSKSKILGLVLVLLLPLLVLGNGVAQGVDALLAPYESGARQFTRSEIGDKIVYLHQRMVGDAIVEKDFIVYQFDKKSEKFLKQIVNWREDVQEAAPAGELISQQDAEALVEGEVQFSQLYIISPESDVFPLDPTPSNPCWVVRSVVNGRQVDSIIDAVTGDFLGNGITPPWEGFSLGGPNWGDTPPCDTYYYPWATNARTHFNALGYPTYAANNPSDATVRSYIQSPSSVVFYELAHGSWAGFHNTCPNSEGDITPAMVKSWIAPYRKMPFAFIGSCGGLCYTGSNSLSYEFRKGSSESATTAGYCDMAAVYCADCWPNSIDWQNKFFGYVKAGKTIKQSVAYALADYPQCAQSEGNCMRFAGDPYFKLGSRDEIMGVGGTWSSGSWYRNLARETWHKPFSYTPNGAIALGDITGDGKADMVSVWTSGLWVQNGATYGWQRIHTKPPGRIATGDIDGDGRDEIIGTGGTWSSGIWYRNVRTGTWYKPFIYTPNGEIAAGDVNRDGRADMVSVWNSGLWYQDGRTWRWTRVHTKPPGQIACGDLNSDGWAEIVGYGGTWSSGIWYRNLRTATWHKPYAYNPPRGDLAVGDVTGDRYADMVSTWSSGLWYQNGRNWRWTRVYAKPPGRIAAGDISGN